MSESTHAAATTVPRDRVLPAATLALSAVSLVGAAISVATDLNPTYLDALGGEARLSVPLPMIVAQVALAFAAGSTRRTVALVGSGLLATVLMVSVISGFFDGGYTDDRLDTGQHAFQYFLVASLFAVGVLALRRFVSLRRR